MAAPASKSPAKAHHVLFFVRNPNGISSIISYLTNRSIKTWTATSLIDAATKIRNHNIQMVFVSISLKNVSVFSVIEALKNEFNIPIVIFSEVASRKIEDDMAKLSTSSKIVPPNQNAKFFQQIQKNLSAGAKVSGEAGADVEDLLPANVEPIDGPLIPDQGRWLKISADDRKVAPYTYKLMQPRNATVGRVRYFYVGPKSPDVNLGGRGWTGSDGLFYIAGRIVEVVEEPNALEVVQPTPDAENDSVARETDLQLDEDYPADAEDTGPWERQLKPRASLGGHLRKHWDALLSKFSAGSLAPGKFGQEFFKGWQNGLEQFREIASNFLSAAPPPSTRAPQNVIEKELLRAALSVMAPAQTASGLGEERMVEKLGLALVKAEGITGFVFADLSDATDETWSAFVMAVESLKNSFNKRGKPFEVLFEPEKVIVEPLPLLLSIKSNSGFLFRVENEHQSLIVGFAEANGVCIPKSAGPDEPMTIAAEMLSPDQKLSFDLYLNMPVNEKQVRYFKEGRHIPAKTIARLVSRPGAEIAIDPIALSSYFGYAATRAITKKNKP
jgi:hypothetical protein